MPCLPEVLTLNQRVIEHRLSNAREIRKKLWWMLPFIVVMTFFCWWGTIKFYAPEVKELFALAPSLRLAPVGWLLPMIGVFLVPSGVLAVLRAIPYNGPLTNRLSSLTASIIFLLGGLLLIVALASPLVQNYFLPKLGYTQCQLLEDGSFSLWSTDWVKNPDWCVKGKTRAWVNGQAKVPRQ